MHATPQVGSILLGKYRVERVLGQGGMGFVVAARHEQLGELFAIKMMLPEAMRYQDARERFMREARSVARMRGEHVARVHDVGTLDNGAPYMVMEYLSGDDLSGVLDKRGALPVGEAALYVCQASEAVAEAHALGIVHRDLKPANMFLTRRPNDSPCVKVLDFGISKDLDPNKVGPALTKTGTFVGTPVYMAPEQMANNKSTDARSDIWSLGIILYELVTGTVPFCAESMTELVTQVLTNRPAPPSHVRPGIPPAFEAIVMRCLEKSPDQRFASVRDLMAALQPFVEMSSSVTPAAYPSSPRVPRPSVPDTTTVERPSPLLPMAHASTARIPFADTQLRDDLPTRVQAYSVPPLEPRQTNGAWGTTNRDASGKRGQAWMVAAIAGVGLGVAALAGWFVMRMVLPDNAIAARSAAPPLAAAPPDSAAPVVSAVAVGSARQVVAESVTNLPEKVDVVPSATVPTTNNVVEPKVVVEPKAPVQKLPASKVPDF